MLRLLPGSGYCWIIGAAPHATLLSASWILQKYPVFEDCCHWSPGIMPVTKSRAAVIVSDEDARHWTGD